MPVSDGILRQRQTWFKIRIVLLSLIQAIYIVTREHVNADHTKRATFHTIPLRMLRGTPDFILRMLRDFRISDESRCGH